MTTQTVGVILLTFGTARTIQDIPAYLASVRGGQPVPPELVAEFERRFERVGGSPLVEITGRQAQALQEHLNSERGEGGQGRQPGEDVGAAPPLRLQAQPGEGPRTGEGWQPEGPTSYRVTIGMRHSPPTIRDGLRALGDAGAGPVVAIIMSPQFSSRIMGGYLDGVAAARDELGLTQPIRIAEAWHQAPAFLDALAQRILEALERLPPDARADVPLVFTAHSLPRAVADDEPDYLDQLRQTAEAVAARVGLTADRWRFAYQSAGHTPEEWLRPDLLDLFPELRAEGHRGLLVVPVQFVADHLEVLYDVDVAAADQAARAGLRLARTESLNTSPRFIEALAWVARREVEELKRERTR